MALMTDLQISVPVYLSNDGITMEVWVPYENEEGIKNNPQQMAACASPAKKPQFMRSESGRTITSDY